MKRRNDYWGKKRKKLVRNIVFTTACGAGVSAISSPEGMGPNHAEDRGQHQEG